MARSTTFKNYGRTSKPLDTVSRRIATPKLLSMPTNSSVARASSIFAACLPSAFGTRPTGRFSWRAIELVRSRCFIRSPETNSSLPPSFKRWFVTRTYRAAALRPGDRRVLDVRLYSRPRTAYQAILKLPPAHYLTLRLGDLGGNVQDLRIERYWELKYTPKQILSEDEAVEALLDVLKEAVRLRLIADVPLGALLSGGVDSSIIVALMSGLTSQPVKTFSIGFEEKEFDELPHARGGAKVRKRSP